jgi:hypothetical protein
MDSIRRVDLRSSDTAFRRQRWEPMRLAYVGHVADVMRGATGSRRDTTNCSSRKHLVGTPC